MFLKLAQIDYAVKKISRWNTVELLRLKQTLHEPWMEAGTVQGSVLSVLMLAPRRTDELSHLPQKDAQ